VFFDTIPIPAPVGGFGHETLVDLHVAPDQRPIPAVFSPSRIAKKFGGPFSHAIIIMKSRPES
jgi:hypothetical protein